MPNLGAIAPDMRKFYSIFRLESFSSREFISVKVAENGKRMAENDAYSPYTSKNNL